MTAPPLESCYRRALTVADELGARSIAFPLIGAGAHGWPRRHSIAAAIQTLVYAETQVDEVRLVTLDEALHRQTRAALWAHRPPPVGADTIGSLFDREPVRVGICRPPGMPPSWTTSTGPPARTSSRPCTGPSPVRIRC